MEHALDMDKDWKVTGKSAIAVSKLTETLSNAIMCGVGTWKHPGSIIQVGLYNIGC